MFLRVYFLAAGCVAIGCGSGTLSAPSAVPASGTVVYKNKAYAGIRVTFHPKFSMGSVKFTPSGMTDKDGKFTLSTASPNDGAPPGEYNVAFAFPTVGSDRKSGIETEVDAWKGKYDDPASGKWTATVQRGKTEPDTFKLD